MESVVFGMQLTKKELHYGQIGWFFALVMEFRTDLYSVEISPITLLKSDSSREALPAILKNLKTHRNISGGVSFQDSYR